LEDPRREEKVRECPKTYIKGVFITLGMISGFFGYLIYSNIVSGNIYFSNDVPAQEVSDTVMTSNIILTEHINEEDEYEKPVCKRLEESGERYSDPETVYNGEI
jgi:hypothetical protein